MVVAAGGATWLVCANSGTALREIRARPRDSKQQLLLLLPRPPRNRDVGDRMWGVNKFLSDFVRRKSGSLHRRPSDGRRRLYNCFAAGQHSLTGPGHLTARSCFTGAHARGMYRICSRLHVWLFFFRLHTTSSVSARSTIPPPGDDLCTPAPTRTGQSTLMTSSYTFVIPG